MSLIREGVLPPAEVCYQPLLLEMVQPAYRRFFGITKVFSQIPPANQFSPSNKKQNIEFCCSKNFRHLITENGLNTSQHRLVP
jgi:hypothetical protein